MMIHPDGAIIILEADEMEKLNIEIDMLLRNHPDWDMFTNRPDTIPIIGRIYDELYKLGAKT